MRAEAPKRSDLQNLQAHSTCLGCRADTRAARHSKKRRRWSVAGASAPALASAGDDGAVQLCAPSGKPARCWERRASVRPAGGAYAHGLAWGAAAGGVAPLFVGAWDGELACSLIDLAALGG